MGNNISVPYSGFINGGVREGETVMIRGLPDHKCDSFSVNLCSGPTIEAGDVALHFNPRFRNGSVVRNHKQGGWGAEERAGGMPFHPGIDFIMTLEVKSNGYKVMVNNRHFCDFSHRMAKESAQYLFITGDVTIYSIKSDRAVDVPCTRLIGGGVREGLYVQIGGRTSQNCDSFSVNLCSGPTIEAGDVALHFNPRFRNGSVVRNHKQGGWGAEERAGGMPFHPGKDFTMTLEVKSNGYKVLVNNRHFCDFTHRMAKETVQYLFITGDVTINHINFNSTYGMDFDYPSASDPELTGVRFSYPSRSPSPYGMAGVRFSFPTGPASPYGIGMDLDRFDYPSASDPELTGDRFSFPTGPASPEVPVNLPINGGVQPGKLICVEGTARTGGSRFQVNLACGDQESSDLALHFDVQFSQKVVVRTHRENGQYGNEEKTTSYFPFTPGANFEMMLLCEPQAIKVAVNGSHFIEFIHRIQPIQLISHIQVKGDVSISQIRFP